MIAFATIHALMTENFRFTSKDTTTAIFLESLLKADMSIALEAIQPPEDMQCMPCHAANSA
jgi:hypothetical protein